MTRDESGDVFIGEQRVNRGEWTIAVTNFGKDFYGRYEGQTLLKRLR